MKNRTGIKRRRLTWSESHEHYQAIVNIEKKHFSLIREAPTEKKCKKAMIKRDNEIFDYLKDRDIEYFLGGFYVPEIKKPASV